MEMVKDKVERYREKAQIFLDEDIRAFIITENGDWNYCDIVLVTDKYVYVEHFAGNRNGTKDRIFFIDILKFDEYKEGGK